MTNIYEQWQGWSVNVLWEWGGRQHYESYVKPGDSDFWSLGAIHIFEKQEGEDNRKTL